MKVLFDTNVILDIWGKTDDFFYSYVSCDVALFRQFEPVIATSMISDFVYLLSSRKFMNKQDARKAFEALLDAFEVLDVTKLDCVRAYESSMNDLEDAIIAHCAQRHNIDYIVTRNLRDFKNSPVPALSPEEFVRIFKLPDLGYDEVEM